jgi:hypothetical protein
MNEYQENQLSEALATNSLPVIAYIQILNGINEYGFRIYELNDTSILGITMLESTMALKENRQPIKLEIPKQIVTDVIIL